MYRVYKYKLEAVDEQEIELPWGARILTVQTQKGKPCLWALVNESKERPFGKSFKHRFRVFGTGHAMGKDISNLHYVGTFQLANGDLVFHVFEVRKSLPYAEGP